MKEAAKSRAPRKGAASNLLDGLVQLSFAVQSALLRVAEKHDLTLAQVRLLGILRDRQPAMMELAAVMNLDKSSVTGLVTRAEQRGLVRRLTTPEDRRAVHVTLSAKGRARAKTFVTQLERELSVLVGDLSGKDQARLSAMAGALVACDAKRRHLVVSALPRTR